ncbi:MAG: Ig-like domain-containing protein [Candidatus Dormibacteraeota bacterium]|uniref:Ig-like domain-containing protein n=1 Tax=Candidatus Aeolococcus gillhamiae TaxID=3127015 RepID=A0A934JWM9_9BACT|nr:Ig-like domain-containing protein [Candidatus Dormibacteraeota bacterium]
MAVAAFSLVGTAAVVSAYTPPGSVLGTTQSCSSTNQGSSCQLQFNLKDANGNPVCNATVTFTVNGVAGSKVRPTTSTTDCNGNVGAAFTAGTGCGTATITASSPPASTQTTIQVPCNSGGTLPNTSTNAPNAPMWPPALIALALFVVAGCGLTLRRMRATT